MSEGQIERIFPDGRVTFRRIYAEQESTAALVDIFEKAIKALKEKLTGAQKALTAAEAALQQAHADAANFLATFAPMLTPTGNIIWPKEWYDLEKAILKAEEARAQAALQVAVINGGIAAYTGALKQVTPSDKAVNGSAVNGGPKKKSGTPDKTPADPSTKTYTGFLMDHMPRYYRQADYYTAEGAKDVTVGILEIAGEAFGRNDPVYYVMPINRTPKLGANEANMVYPGANWSGGRLPYPPDSAYQCERDGALYGAWALRPWSWLWNWAMLPGWQRWKTDRQYRVVEILSIDRDTETAEVQLPDYTCGVVADPLGMAPGPKNFGQAMPPPTLDISLHDALGYEPFEAAIDYMGDGVKSWGFREGDRAILRVSDKTIIGHAEGPRPGGIAFRVRVAANPWEMSGGGSPPPGHMYLTGNGWVFVDTSTGQQREGAVMDTFRATFNQYGMDLYVYLPTTGEMISLSQAITARPPTWIDDPGEYGLRTFWGLHFIHTDPAIDPTGGFWVLNIREVWQYDLDIIGAPWRDDGWGLYLQINHGPRLLAPGFTYGGSLDTDGLVPLTSGFDLGIFTYGDRTIHEFRCPWVLKTSQTQVGVCNISPYIGACRENAISRTFWVASSRPYHLDLTMLPLLWDQVMVQAGMSIQEQESVVPKDICGTTVGGGGITVGGVDYWIYNTKTMDNADTLKHYISGGGFNGFYEENHRIYGGSKATIYSHEPHMLKGYGYSFGYVNEAGPFEFTYQKQDAYNNCLPEKYKFATTGDYNLAVYKYPRRYYSLYDIGRYLNVQVIIDYDID